jgi:hypothetical protein
MMLQNPAPDPIKRLDPEQSMLGSSSHNEKIQFPCWSCVIFLLEPHQNAYCNSASYRFAKKRFKGIVSRDLEGACSFSIEIAFSRQDF